MIHLPRFMLAAPSSGSGKTMITCGILQALKNRGLNPASFKCGPDYIDPMFHSKVIGAKSRNLDTFFADERTVRYLFARTASQGRRTSQKETYDMRGKQVPSQGGFLTPGISVFEGVMGIYDGLGGTSAKASSYDLAAVTDTPVILVVNARGMSLSVIPLIHGYVDYQKQLGKEVIRGVILNQTTKMTCMLLKEQIEAQTGICVYGYVPQLADCVVESRHLGLVTPDEIRDLRQRIERLGAELEQCLDMEGILTLADSAADYQDRELRMPEAAAKFCGVFGAGGPEAGAAAGTWRPEAEGCSQNEAGAAVGAPRPEPEECFQNEKNTSSVPRVRIAVAMDEAFCFYYQDNLDLLELMGAEIVPFSPLHDKKLPDRTDGLLLGGGYPELYAKALSENTAMKAQIRDRIEEGMPYLAECGGFMYLHETMEDMEGNAYPMCGCIEGEAYRTPKLSRFGYITLEVAEGGKTSLASGQKKAAEGGKTSLATEQKEAVEGGKTSLATEQKEVAEDGKTLSAPEQKETACEHNAGKKTGDTAGDANRSGLFFAERQTIPIPAISANSAMHLLLAEGQTIRAHEFHYFDSTNPGSSCTAKKPTGSRQWSCIHGTDRSMAGYPHLYYWSNPEFAYRFLEKVREQKNL